MKVIQNPVMSFLSDVFMKIRLLLVFMIISLNATAKIQYGKISLKANNVPLKTIFSEIEKQTDYTFLYTAELLKKANRVSIDLENASLNDVLKQVFLKQPFNYTIYNKFVVVNNGVSNPLKLQETYLITGTVNDEKGAPIPGATVFLADTRAATATDASGNFRLDEPQPGVYQLVVKMLGFTVYTQQLIIRTAPPALHIILKETNIELKTVNITAISAEKRQEYLQLFIKYFIGQSVYAAKCKLLNPEVISFSYNKDTHVLEANSEKFILIENKELGYKLHYLLTAFNLDLLNHTLYYDGSSFFEELGGTKSEQERWEKNRELVYEGSKWHFFKAAFENKLKEEGFLIYRLPTPRAWAEKAIVTQDSAYFVPFDRTDSLFTKVDENIKSLNLSLLKTDTTMLYVVYTPKNEPYEYTLSGRHLKIPQQIDTNRVIHKTPRFKDGSGQISIIYPLTGDSMLIDKNGNTNPKNAIGYAGYWTWFMASGFLPPDYKIPDKNISPAKK